MASRATKSGLAAEAQAKMGAKYDEEFAGQIMAWIRDRTVGSVEVNTDGRAMSVYETLKDGYILCHLMTSLGCTLKFKQEKMAFKQMENISKFLQAATAYGVDSSELFQTVDLYENQNITSVVTGLGALARKVKAKGGPGIGPKEAERNSRNFTDEQMKAGQNVIGLQMGTNKGASQAGQNFGKARMIVD